jgi:hypothetical protein
VELGQKYVRIPHVGLVVLPPRILALFLFCGKREDFPRGKQRGWTIAVRAREEGQGQAR